MNNIDYKIIVTKDYLDDILMHSIDFFSFIHEGTMRGEPDKINGVDVEYRGSIFVGDMNIGIYLMKKEIDKDIKKWNKIHANVREKVKKMRDAGLNVRGSEIYEMEMKELEKLEKRNKNK